MAFYITPDGRVHSVDVDVKNGNVRPQSYHAFDNEMTSDSESVSQKTKSRDYQSLKNKYKQIKQKAKIERKHRKFKLEQYRQQLGIILESSDLSDGAKCFVKNCATAMNKIKENQKLLDNIYKNGLQPEENAILNVLQQVNQLIKEQLSSTVTA